MSKLNLNKEEEIIRQQLEEASFPYQEAHWAEMQQQLQPSGGGSGWSKFAKFGAAAITTATVILGVYYFSGEDENVIANNDKQPIVEENIHAPQQAETVKELTTENSTMVEDVQEEIATATPTKSEDTQKPERSTQTTTQQTEIPEPNIYPPPAEDNDSRLSNNSSQEAGYEDVSFEILGYHCKGQVIRFVAMNADAYEVLWEFGDGNTSKQHRLNYTYSTWGDFTVRLNILKEGKTVYQLDEPLMVRDFKTPEIQWSEGKGPFDDFQLNLSVKEAFAGTYKWSSPSIDQEVQGSTTQLHYEGPINETLRLEFINNYGCSAILTEVIDIQKDFVLYAEEAFTPDVDGINDDFMPALLREGAYDFEMKIFDRNNVLVYQTKDASKPWNGRRNNLGERLPIGTYGWKVAIFDEQHRQQRLFSGQIKVLDL